MHVSLCLIKSFCDFMEGNKSPEEELILKDFEMYLSYLKKIGLLDDMLLGENH